MQQKVLVVDDEPDVIELLGFNLRAAGYWVETATTGLQALNKARYILPDIIILDLLLPELDGTAVCEILRVLPSTATIPILMLTACSSTEAKAIAVQAGVNDFITKPFSPADLTARVGRALEMRAALSHSDGEAESALP